MHAMGQLADVAFFGGVHEAGARSDVWAWGTSLSPLSRIFCTILEEHRISLHFNLQRVGVPGGVDERARARILLDMNTPEMEALRAFRYQVYTLFGCRRDALFEALDAVLSAPALETPAHLSLAPHCQRGWGSLYAARSARNYGSDAARMVGRFAPTGTANQLVCRRRQCLAAL